MGAARLTKFYPQAVTDFYGSGELCVYKTGDPWPVAQGPESQNIIRAARPIYDHPIAPKWLETAWNIVRVLDSLQVRLNTVNPLACANAGEAALICSFVITIGVLPTSLTFKAAVAAAEAVKGILERVGFPDIQVAFVESIYRRYGGGPKLMTFNPTIQMEGLPGLRKHFTPTLSPAIAPLKTPHFEGSGGLYFRLSSDETDKRVVLLTCAHVSHPPPAFENKAYTRKNDSQPREDMVLLGTGAFDDAVKSIMGFIGDQTVSITTWESSLARLPEEAPNEAKAIAARRKELTGLIQTAKDKIEEADTLHTQVTKNFTTTDSRVFGFVLHVAKIEVGADNVLYDWSFIQVDEDKIDWDEFKGNMVFVGGNKTDVDWKNYMFPQPHDSRGYNTPDDLLLQIKGFVPESEFRNPQNYDIHDVKTLLAVKNGRTTNTTYGRVNGLESITRSYPEHGIQQDAVEHIVFGYDTATGKNDRFSDKGDSGAWAFTRDGRAIGQITGGGGPSDKTDKTYITAGHKIKAAIEAVFPSSFLYPIPA